MWSINPYLLNILKRRVGRSLTDLNFLQLWQCAGKPTLFWLSLNWIDCQENVAFTSKLLESDVEIVFCDFPQANRLILHIISSIAEYEAGLISQRTKQSLQAKKARGVRLGKSENLMNKFEQAVQHSIITNKAKADNNPNNMRAIALLRSLSMQGKSLSEMTCLLNEQGFVTSKGCKFQITQVKRLLVRAGLM